MDFFRRSNYHFDLPDNLIAAYPLAHREDARLMVIHKASERIEHRTFRELPEILPAQSMLVANNTKVFRARLQGQRAWSKGKIELFLLKKLGPTLWQGLIRSSARVAPGFIFSLGSEANPIQAEVIAREDTNSGTLFTVNLSADPVLAGIGEVPLPPYITAKRADITSGTTEKLPDELEIYNTVFAKNEGSVASPTAGRHFSVELIENLKKLGFGWEELTLHVGLGTFKPVMVDDIREHKMHPEVSFIAEEVAKRILLAKQQKRKIIAVGTTSTRTLEGRASRNEAGDIELASGDQDVNLFIYPRSEHDWKLVDGILTNFHLPESTLLMMITAFIDAIEWMREIYQIAVKEQYRFYSYGDAMLILPE